MSDAEDGGAASAEGRAEEIGVSADCILQGGLALSELAFDFGFAFEGQQWMSEGVVTDDVAGVDDFAGDLGTLLDIFSDQKESRGDSVFGEDFEQA